MLLLRKLDRHYFHCSLLELPDDAQDFSKEYGVKRQSILCKAPEFDVCQCLPHDIMHVILEGVLQLHSRLILQNCKSQGYITVTAINVAIKNFPYGENEKPSTPGPVNRERLADEKSKLAQSCTYIHVI